VCERELDIPRQRDAMSRARLVKEKPTTDKNAATRAVTSDADVGR